MGQDAAKRAVAIALRNRTRRLRLPDDVREEIIPKNILMIGPTGVGKTEIARRLAALANAPFVKVEATKFTEVGYVGRDVDSMVRDLAQIAYRMVENEEVATVQAKAEEAALERVLDLLQPAARPGRGHSVERFAAAMGEWLSKQSPDAEELHPPREVLEARRPDDEGPRLRRRRQEQTTAAARKLRNGCGGELDDRRWKWRWTTRRAVYAGILAAGAGGDGHGHLRDARRDDAEKEEDPAGEGERGQGDSDRADCAGDGGSGEGDPGRDCAG